MKKIVNIVNLTAIPIRYLPKGEGAVAREFPPSGDVASVKSDSYFPGTVEVAGLTVRQFWGKGRVVGFPQGGPKPDTVYIGDLPVLKAVREENTRDNLLASDAGLGREDDPWLSVIIAPTSIKGGETGLVWQEFVSYSSFEEEGEEEEL